MVYPAKGSGEAVGVVEANSAVHKADSEGKAEAAEARAVAVIKRKSTVVRLVGSHGGNVAHEGVVPHAQEEWGNRPYFRRNGERSFVVTGQRKIAEQRERKGEMFRLVACAEVERTRHLVFHADVAAKIAR